MLQWLVDRQISTAGSSGCGRLVEESEVEVRPEKRPDAATDNVDIYLIRKYFTNDAWLLLTDVLQIKKENAVFCLQIRRTIDCV